MKGEEGCGTGGSSKISNEQIWRSLVEKYSRMTMTMTMPVRSTVVRSSWYTWWRKGIGPIAESRARRAVHRVHGLIHEDEFSSR